MRPPNKAARLRGTIDFLEQLHQDMQSRPGAYVHARIKPYEVLYQKHSLQAVLSKRLRISARKSLDRLEQALGDGQSIRVLALMDEAGNLIEQLEAAWVSESDEKVHVHAVQWLIDYNKLKIRDRDHQQDRTWLLWLVPSEVSPLS